MQREKKCILIIDDVLTQLHALIQILQLMYTVKIVKNGRDGLRFVNKNEVDLIFLDMVMPGLSGLDVLEKLKMNDKVKHIPVVMATGNSTEEEIKKCFYLGASDYIIKPFEKDKVLKCIEKLIV